MKIDFANLKRAYQAQQKEFDLALQKVLDSTKYIMGPEVEDLENQLSAFTGSNHAISCSSGTDALLLALMALDIGPGDEVITTPFSFISTAETIALLGAKPVFVDIDEASYNIDASLIESKINPTTKAIIPVSLFGQVSDMDDINALGLKHNISVIEDAAQSFGATYKGKRSCNLSTLACTSFFPSKPLGCFGDGGAVFTNNKGLAEKIKCIRLHGQTQRYNHKYIGLGARLDTLQASVLLVKLKRYEEDIKRRQEVANRYHKLLQNNLNTPQINKENTSVWAQYSIRLTSRDEVQKKLQEKGVPTSVHYPKPMHLQECFEYLGYKKGDFPVSESVSKEIISLPMNPYISPEEQEYICNELKKLL
ncbi:MAG: DegT/DnrJ/EryC1/StrS family aminotransferase [Flavobacteriales bacterium]|nr:DegT/DnrJ/EryC1/StrS family aminotransferase [Flavobacteriales bacterium]